MSRTVATCALLLTVALPSSARADGPEWFVTGGPGVGRTSELILPGDTGPSPVSSESGMFEPADTEPEGRARLLMLGFGMVGSEGPIRAGAEVMSLVGHRGDATSGYTAFVTYAGANCGVGFVQAGLGLGSFWGGDRRGLDRIAGAAHGELGVRLSSRVAILVRGDILLGSEIVNPVASIGLQWIPGQRPPAVKRAKRREDHRRRNPLEGQPAI